MEEFRGLLLRFRGRTRMSQAQLAARAGVHLRSVQSWESGLSFPSVARLQTLIVALLSAGGLAPGAEVAEAQALWSTVERDSARHHPPFDASWFASVQSEHGAPQRDGAARASESDRVPIRERIEDARAQDWGDAPDSVGFLGRRSELHTLNILLAQDATRLLVLSGMGGMGKTSLAARFGRDIAAEFQRVYWRSTRDAPPFSEWSAGAIGFLADHRRVAPDGDAARIDVLVELMRNRRCLLVLDNLEALLEPGRHDGSFRAENAAYATFLAAAADRAHQSVVLVTSREVPLVLARTSARVVEVGGLKLADIQRMLNDKGLIGDEDVWTKLVSRYAGNGLALRVVGEAIRNVFGGDIASFVEQVPSGTVFSGIRRLLDAQFARLSPVEVLILQLLAIAREPMSFGAIAAELAPHASRSVVLEALEALRHRSLIEPSATSSGFALQSVMLEYVTDQLVERGVDEVAQGQLDILLKWPLIRAQDKDYVRRTQEVLIGRAILERLDDMLRASAGESTEGRLVALLDTLRGRNDAEQGYGPGNLTNLLRLLRGDLRGIDFSRLSIRQAYLQDIEAQDARFAGARLSAAVLDDSFGTVSSVAISRDGLRFAAGTLAGSVRVWRLVDRALLLTERGHRAAIWGVALSEDGQQLASCGLDGAVRLWDLGSGIATSLTDKQSGGFTRVLLSADGRRLITGGLDGKIRLWDAVNRQPLATLEGHTGAVYGLAAGGDGLLLSSSGQDGSVRLWDVESGRQLMELLGHDGPVWSVALSRSGELVVSGGGDGTVRVWNMATGNLLAMLEGHVGAVRNVDVSADGQTIVSGGFDGSLRIWEGSSGRRIATLHAHSGGVRGVALSVEGSTVVSGGFDGTVRLWDAQAGLLLATLEGHTGGVRGVALSADGGRVVCGGPETNIRTWDVGSSRVVARLDGHSGGVRGIVLSADDRVLASSGLDNSVRLWDFLSGRPLGIPEGHAAGVLAVAIDSDGQTVASASLDGTVRLWDTRLARCLAVLEGHTGAVWDVAMTPRGDAIASSGVDGVRLWDAANRQQLLHLEGHRGGVRSVALSADGRTIVTGGDDAMLRVWDSTTGKSTAILSGHTAAVYGVAVSPDARMVASGSFDGTVRLWDSRDGRPMAVLEGHSDAVYDVVISGDGGTIASGSLDGTVKLWDATSFALAHTFRPDRRYERMDITGLTGVTEAQRDTLFALGAIDRAA